MDVFKCEVCGCRWRRGRAQVGDDTTWLMLNATQVSYPCCEDRGNLRLIEQLDPALYPARRFDLDGAWRGETVVVLGHAAQAFTDRHFEALTDSRVVAVNQAVRLVPDADLFVALDPHHPFWDRVKGFTGIKILGVPSLVGSDYDLREHDPYYAGMMYESVLYAPGHMIELRNNYIAALRIVERLRVGQIIMMGLDAPAYDRAHAHTGFFGFTQALAKVEADLRAKGIKVEVVS